MVANLAVSENREVEVVQIASTNMVSKIPKGVRISCGVVANTTPSQIVPIPAVRRRTASRTGLCHARSRVGPALFSRGDLGTTCHRAPVAGALQQKCRFYLAHPETAYAEGRRTTDASWSL